MSARRKRRRKVCCKRCFLRNEKRKTIRDVGVGGIRQREVRFWLGSWLLLLRNDQFQLCYPEGRNAVLCFNCNEERKQSRDWKLGESGGLLVDCNSSYLINSARNADCTDLTFLTPEAKQAKCHSTPAVCARTQRHRI